MTMHAPIRSYEVTRWSTHCADCGAVLEQDFASATAAREAYDNLVGLDGTALCDDCIYAARLTEMSP